MAALPSMLQLFDLRTKGRQGMAVERTELCGRDGFGTKPSLSASVQRGEIFLVDVPSGGKDQEDLVFQSIAVAC